jgi:hypothetical protein
LQAEEIARQLLAIRSWERRTLPLGNSLMAAEVIYLITSKASADPVRVKDLHLTLGYSEARVRQILHALADDGWLSVERHGIDGRMRSIRHTDRTALALLSIQQQLSASLMRDK